MLNEEVIMSKLQKPKCGIYIHGSRGDFTEEKANELEEFYGIPFFGITYPWTDVDVSEVMLRSHIVEAMKDFSPIIVGNSFGALFAMKFSKEFALPCVLTNPLVSMEAALISHEDLGVSKIFWNCCQEYSDSIDKEYEDRLTIVSGDDLIDHSITERLLVGGKFVALPTGTHKFTQYNEVQDELREFIGTISVPEISRSSGGVGR